MTSGGMGHIQIKTEEQKNNQKSWHILEIHNGVVSSWLLATTKDQSEQ